MTNAEFIAFMTDLHDDMHRLATAVTGSPEDASDAVQETMLKLWRVRQKIPPDRPGAEAYCFKSIRMNCYTLLSRRKPEENIPDIPLPAEDAADSRAIFSDSQRILMQLIDRLPDNQKTVIRLSSLEGADIARTAKMTDLTETNVRQLLSRARKTLREKLSELNN